MRFRTRRPAKSMPKRLSSKKKVADTPKAASICHAIVVTIAIIIPVILLLIGSNPTNDDVHVEAPVARKVAKQPKACTAADHFMCDAWVRTSECSSSVEKRRCPHACGLCLDSPPAHSSAPHEERCKRVNTTVNFASGELTSMFKRILREYPQYAPVALSTDPYVVLLKDFVSAQEAAALRMACDESHFQSSAATYSEEVRTSHVCWCSFPECFAHELIHNVTARIHQLTRTPYNHGEDMQIVRYHPGAYYKSHHDQNQAVWTPQGPRVLTFFMYLSEEKLTGGETAFGKLESTLDGRTPLTVLPKLGDAVLWPSVLDKTPMETDWRTDHEAMPVKAGVKFGANMWIHHFDWKTPASRGCELTRVNTFGRQPTKEFARLVSQGLVPTYRQSVAASLGEPIPSDGDVMDDSIGSRDGFGSLRTEWPELVGKPAQAASEMIHADRPDVNIFFIKTGAVAPESDHSESRVLIWVERDDAAHPNADDHDANAYRVAEPAPRLGS